MGLSSGRQPLPYGHSTGAAVDIEGLAVCYAAFANDSDSIFSHSYLRTI